MLFIEKLSMFYAKKERVWLRGSSYMAEHRNRPTLSMELGNIQYMLTNFREQNYYVFNGEIRQSSNAMDIDIV